MPSRIMFAHSASETRLHRYSCRSRCSPPAVWKIEYDFFEKITNISGILRGLPKEGPQRRVRSPLSSRSFPLPVSENRFPGTAQGGAGEAERADAFEGIPAVQSGHNRHLLQHRRRVSYAERRQGPSRVLPSTQHPEL